MTVNLLLKLADGLVVGEYVGVVIVGEFEEIGVDSGRFDNTEIPWLWESEDLYLVCTFQIKEVGNRGSLTAFQVDDVDARIPYVCHYHLIVDQHSELANLLLELPSVDLFARTVDMKYGLAGWGEVGWDGIGLWVGGEQIINFVDAGLECYLSLVLHKHAFN